jgi:GT2 family glycosyltransferase/tetratricopeptide (TPR) repeat protein
MAVRYLFGPVPGAFAVRSLGPERARGACLTFGPAADADLRIGPNDTWEQVCTALPDGRLPDFVVLALPGAVPACLWSAPVPVVALAADGDLFFHAYRLRLSQAELVLADAPTAVALTRAGISHAHAAELCGPARSFLDAPWPEGARDLDVLLIEDPSTAPDRGRLPWLTRLARLAERRRIVVHSATPGEDCRDLLGRARVVLHRGRHGDCTRRAFEAAAAGALLFVEAGDRVPPGPFINRQECVWYTADDFERLLVHYLDREDERRAFAEAGRARAAAHAFEAQWEQALGQIERDWPALQERRGRRSALSAEEDLLARAAEALDSPARTSLVSDLAAAVARHPRSAALHNALGLTVAQAAGGASAAAAETAVGYFARASDCQAAPGLPGLNLAEALCVAGKPALAAEHARRALAGLDRSASLSPTDLSGGLYPPVMHSLRVQWERAAWENAGRPAAEARAKRSLLRGRLHTLLGELTGELPHYYEAALAAPDLPGARAALGCALARARRVGEALPHLRAAVAADPLDGAAARALFGALGEAGDEGGRRCLARDRRLLARLAPHTVPAEPWFADGPPGGDELASLIILCCDQLADTRDCLESVLRHTRAPYELVLVDNGSTDGTAAYLEEVRARPGPQRVAVIRNAHNRGFPAGCNRGLAEARGRYLVFLHNDTVVTAGWLDGLIGWALHDWPAVGLVGAVTNCSRGPQQVEADYAGPEGLEAFAGRRARAYAGRALAAPRLAGFCLLARREVLEQVGGFDEGYGLGLFEDDDLSVRALRAGYRLVVAQDVFVHHHGGRTFAGLGVDSAELLRANFAKFQARCGPGEAASYGLCSAPAGATLSATARPTPVPLADARGPAAPDVAPTAVVTAEPAPARVSLCLIVKDEEHNLPDCLGSAADLVDEVVVVDTGSADRTKEVAARFGAKVFDFPWCDSFAAARNEGLRHATGAWIFWMDADDRLDEDNRARLRALFAGLQDDNAAYVMKCLCLPDQATGTATLVDHVRLFRNLPAVRWRYRVHEQILPAVREHGGAVRWSDVVIHHTGYLDPALRGRKLERDLRLLRLQQEEQPDEPFTLFNLGSVYNELNRPEEALPLLRRSLERSQPTDSIVRKLYALIAQCHRQLYQPRAALAVCREGRGHYPDDPELLFQEGMILRYLGDLAGAEACWVRVLHTPAGQHFSSVHAGLRGYLARHNLGLLYQQQGRLPEAESQWRAALGLEPGFVPARVGLTDILLAQGRWAEVEAEADRMQGQPGAELPAAVVRGRVRLGRKEYAAAREVLAKACARFPEAVLPRVFLSYAYLEEGQDLAGAERAVRAVLELEPGQEEARQNLTLLLTRQGRPADLPPVPPPTLEELYRAACLTPSDLNEHCPTLCELARACPHITALGTRGGAAAVALLAARPQKLVCCDSERHPQLDVLLAVADPTQLVFRQADALDDEAEETDLLLLAGCRVYDRLRELLRGHAGRARRYVVVHDTTRFGDYGAEVGRRGLWPAVEELLAEGGFRLKERHTDNHGLAVLERVRP